MFGINRARSVSFSRLCKRGKAGALGGLVSCLKIASLSNGGITVRGSRRGARLWFRWVLYYYLLGSARVI